MSVLQMSVPASSARHGSALPGCALSATARGGPAALLGEPLESAAELKGVAQGAISRPSGRPRRTTPQVTPQTMHRQASTDRCGWGAKASSTPSSMHRPTPTRRPWQRSCRPRRARRRTAGAIAEPPNGWIKSVLGFRQFSLRGLRRVQAEVKLVCMALNLRRMGAMRVV